MGTSSAHQNMHIKGSGLHKNKRAGRDISGSPTREGKPRVTYRTKNRLGPTAGGSEGHKKNLCFFRMGDCGFKTDHERREARIAPYSKEGVAPCDSRKNFTAAKKGPGRPICPTKWRVREGRWGFTRVLQLFKDQKVPLFRAKVQTRLKSNSK